MARHSLKASKFDDRRSSATVIEFVLGITICIAELDPESLRCLQIHKLIPANDSLNALIKTV